LFFTICICISEINFVFKTNYMKSIKKLFIFGLLVFTCNLQIKANNIQIANVVLTGQNTTSDFTQVQFNINWENSWRVSSGPSNWDAAWVFVKYRVGTGPWLHAFLNNTGHVTGTGTAATITPGLMNTANAFNSTTNPAMGVFVHRSGVGAGAFTQTGLQLRWNYGANGIADGDAVDIKVFAVEMAFVPQGAFQVGDGSVTSVQGQFRNGSTNTPFSITSENALTLGGTANGNLANNNASGMALADDFNNTTTRSLPAAFPKGFNAFYCMKYEISQQQWIDFFNVLSSAQQAARDITGGTFNSTGKGSDAVTNRNNISWTSGDATLNGGTFGNVACNFLSWMDGAAFADWAALRPMTELEFEKACRGGLTPVANEFAWGTTNITGATGISNSGANNELASNAGANAVFNNNANVQGPLRVGSFATGTSTREQAGASYYGIMDLSGNVWERTVSVGNATGRNFTAPIHGNGLLTTDGFCDISTWPGFVTDKVIGASGAGFRGGVWGSTSVLLRASDRFYASHLDTERNSNHGFRAVRSVP
jgi:formylglycine-generating enzyme required for sulfatase activity